MEILTAQDAWDITEEIASLELTPERVKLLERIKEEARFAYQLKFAFVMSEKDITFFEKLGYDVTNASYADSDGNDIVREAGIISWKHPE